MKQVVWFSEIKWDYLRTRKQQIISRKPADVQLLYLEPYVKGRRNFFRLRTEGDIFCVTIPFVKSAPFFPWRNVLDQRSARRLVDLIARSRIQRVLKQLNFDTNNVGFVISNIYAADIAIELPKRFLLYDCNDAHSSFPGMRAWSETYFYRTSRHADAVFASSQALLESVGAVRGNAGGCEYLGNGVDYEHFQDGAAPARTSSKRLRFGYLGALSPWLDFESLSLLATRHPEWEVALVGPILHGVEAQILELTSLPNVSRLAAVPYDRLPEILRQFDVGLIPFRYNELTRGVNPNKQYEYLAAGLPVVSTRFSEEVQRYPELVKSVDPGDPFVAACEHMAARMDSDDIVQTTAEKAREIARENDWDVIASTFWERVDGLFSKTHDKL